ncbi:MAG: hypothetical protein LUD03_06010 [Firmicutes bacterium]|nr:hypothetical protein [Bacillota bacterium]
MNCDKFSKMLDNYENLTEDEKSAMLAHSRECEKCEQELNFMLSVKNTLRTLPKIEVPADFIDKLNERIDREEAVMTRRESFSRHMKNNWQRYSAFAASLALAAVIGVNGKSMIDIINGSDDGVISQTASVSASPEDETAVQSENAVVSESDGASSAYSPNVVLPPALQNHRARAAASESGASSDAASAATDTINSVEESAEISVQTQTAADTAAAETETRAAEVESTAAPQAASQTAAPQAATSAPDTAAVYTAEETPAANDGGYVISDDAGTETYAYVGDSEASTKARSSSSYSVSGEAYSEDVHIPIDGILTINSSNYETAITVIAKYVLRVYNECYVINGTQFNSMLDELRGKDVSFDSSVIQNSDTVSFKIIVVK